MKKSLHSHSGNIKQTWKTINEILNKSSNKNKSIEIKAENGEMLDGTSISDTFKGIWQQKIFLPHLKELLKLFSKLFYSFYISRLVFEILRLEERKKSMKSAILDIHGYARFTSQQGSRNFFFFNQTLL